MTIELALKIASMRDMALWMMWSLAWPDPRHTPAESPCAEALGVLAADVERLRPALTNLVEKLDVITAHPAYHGMMTLTYVHGCAYNGPDWSAELAQAKAALEVK